MMRTHLKRALLSVITIIFLCVPLLCAYGAQKSDVVTKDSSGNKIYVIDNAGILSDSDEQKLADQCQTATEKCKTDIVIMTLRTGLDYSDLDNYVRSIINDSYGYEGESSNGSNPDATVYAIDMVSRADRIITSGKAKSDISQDTLDSIRKTAEDYLADGDYYSGCKSFVTEMRHQLTTSIVDKLLYGIWVDIIIAVVVTAVVLFIMVYNTKAKMTADGRTYKKNIKIKQREDHYINTTVTTRTIQSNSGRSGGGGGGNSGSSGGHF